MINLRKAILAAADNEPIQAIVVGIHYDERYNDAEQPRSPKELLNRILSWADAEELLNYEYDNGYGGADCHPIIAWTQNRVLFIHEYDGSTSVSWLPRNPTDITPEFSGQ